MSTASGQVQPDPVRSLSRELAEACRQWAGIATEAPQGRHSSNYPELLERLSDHGVLILDPGRHDIRALHGLIGRARGFVGIHGAGLANAFLASGLTGRWLTVLPKPRIRLAA